MVTQAFCFDASVFNERDFDVAAFIASVSAQTPLQELRDDLASYLSNLRSQIVDIINSDFEETRHLSTKVSGMEVSVESLRGPIRTVRDQICDVNDAVTTAISVLDQKLQEKQKLREKRSILELCIRVSDEIRAMETLLEITRIYSETNYQSNSDGDDDDVVAAQACKKYGNPKNKAEVCALLYRVAVKWVATRSEMNQGAGVTWIQKLKERVTEIELTLEEELENAFSDEISFDSEIDQEVLLSCLQAYATMGKVETAEEIFATLVVRPFVELHLTRAKLDGGGRRGSCAGLKGMYEEILDFLERQCKDILYCSLEAPGMAGYGFDFLGNSVWKEIFFTLENKAILGGIFSPSPPDVFHTNLQASSEFLDNVVLRFCHNVHQKKKWRENEITRKFVQKWRQPISVYYQLRWGATMKKIGEVLSAHQLEPSESEPKTCVQADASDGGSASADAPLPTPALANPSQKQSELKHKLFLLPQTEAVWGCMQECWDKSVFVLVLTNSFFRLNLELLQKYTEWAFNHGAKIGLNATEIATAEKLVAHGNDSNDSGQIHLHPSFSAVLTATVAHDVALLRDKLAGLMEKVVTEQLSESGLKMEGPKNMQNSDSVEMVLVQGINEEWSKLTPQIDGCWTALRTHLVALCVGRLAELKGVAATYRMASKPLPSGPSGVSSRVLEPLQTFHATWSHLFRAISSEIVGPTTTQAGYDGWMKAISAEITEAYHNKVIEVVDASRKLELSLQKRLKKKPSAAATSSSVSNSQKICAQLILDIQDFGNELRNIGSDPTLSDEYQALSSEATLKQPSEA